MVARFGGDEFVIVQTGVLDRSEAEAFARRIMSILSASLYFKEVEIFSTSTIGVAIAPRDGATADRLLTSADLALYAGKTAGRNCVRFFLSEMDESMRKRVELEKRLRDVVTHEGLVLQYQPVLEMNGRHLVGFEALVRLPAPDGTLIPPEAFLPLAEDLRLIDKIGDWVLREACCTAMSWPEHLSVAVNLSPAQFASGSIEEAVVNALRKSGLSPNRLELEITETLSFMMALEESDDGVETVLKSIIDLGREMKMRVTVEGVETERQVDFLYDAHADQVQGFYFGEPLAASELGAGVLRDFRTSLGVDNRSKAETRRSSG